jgi:hypothetical protein
MSAYQVRQECRHAGRRCGSAGWKNAEPPGRRRGTRRHPTSQGRLLFPSRFPGEGSENGEGTQPGDRQAGEVGPGCCGVMWSRACRLRRARVAGMTNSRSRCLFGSHRRASWPFRARGWSQAVRVMMASQLWFWVKSYIGRTTARRPRGRPAQFKTRAGRTAKGRPRIRAPPVEGAYAPESGSTSPLPPPGHRADVRICRIRCAGPNRSSTHGLCPFRQLTVIGPRRPAGGPANRR